MTVFRSRTFRKNVARRISRKLWRLKKARQGKQIRQTRKLKQKGGYVPYRGIPSGSVIVNPLAWDE